MGDRVQKFDSVIAPDFDPDAIKVFQRPKDKCRVVRSPSLNLIPVRAGKRVRQTNGGLLVQPDYCFVLEIDSADMKVFGKRDHRMERDIVLASAIGRTSNSNTITIVRNQMLLGNGVGQQDRVGAAELAIKRAVDAGHKDRLEGAVAYSDSFFPFPDAVGALINVGIKAIFSTSGSVNDELTQNLCEEKGVTLYQLPDSKARGFFGH